MRSLVTSVLLGLGALGMTVASPAQAQASWLSEYLHRRFDPGYSYPPPYSYYGPAYVNPGYAYDPGYFYEATPYYAPYSTYYFGAPYPRYGARWYGYGGRGYGDRHEWHEHHGHDGHRHR